MTANELVSKIIDDCAKPVIGNGLTLAKLQATAKIMGEDNSAIRYSSEYQEFMGFKFIELHPISRKSRWRMFPQFYI